MSDSENTVRDLLNKIALEHGYNKSQIVLNEIESGGANYTSKLYTVIIKECNKADLHMFAKVATVGEKFREEVPSTIFSTERFAYTHLIKTYQAIEEENKVPEEHRLQFTKFYGCDPSAYQETVILENLLVEGYGPFERLKPLTWEYAYSAILDLAKFHALSLAYSEKSPDNFAKDLAKIKFDWKEGMMDYMFNKSFELAASTVQPEYKDVLMKFMDKYKEFYPYFNNPVVRPFIIHADFRGNNLLHRVREDGKVDIKIVDFQTIQAGCPVTDLLYFIVTGSDEHFRTEYYDKLIDHYYTELSAAMRRLHLNPEEIYSRTDFDFELKEKLPYSLSFAICALPMITVEVEDAPKLDENLAMSNMWVKKTSSLYPERLHGIIRDYVKWGVLK